LIQGSTIIYSKKVEYLYTLLYQTLDFLIEKRKKGGQHNKSTAEDGSAADESTLEEFQDKDAEFLTLDDIPEANNIDLDDSVCTARIALPLLHMCLTSLLSLLFLCSLSLLFQTRIECT